jgi:hypothetical protein
MPTTILTTLDALDEVDVKYAAISLHFEILQCRRFHGRQSLPKAAEVHVSWILPSNQATLSSVVAGCLYSITPRSSRVIPLRVSHSDITITPDVIVDTSRLKVP